MATKFSSHVVLLKSNLKFTYWPTMKLKYRLLNDNPEADSTGGGETPKADTKSTTGATPEQPKATPEQPQATPEQPKADTKSTIDQPKVSSLSIDDVKELIKVLKHPEETPPSPKENPQEPEQPKVDPRDLALRNLLIQSAQVPTELLELLPADLTALSTYLESSGYKAAAQKLTAANSIQPPNGNNPEPTVKAPKDKPSNEFKPPTTFAQVTQDMLKAFDAL